jgi:hypothetical protein
MQITLSRLKSLLHDQIEDAEHSMPRFANESPEYVTVRNMRINCEGSIDLLATAISFSEKYLRRH